ncbi:MAG: DUF4258 domain-containing protein [Planctomycetota bacterium]|nr:hypothetical protein [Planctomycetaceae bacterium]MDQ3329505.1 DUF4258 domain-containing protein [Planctomycetota bacterium]
MHVAFLWDDYNLVVIRARGLTESEIEYALEHGATDADVSNMSGWPVLFGVIPDGRTIAVVFRWEDANTIYVLDAEAES